MKKLLVFLLLLFSGLAVAQELRTDPSVHEVLSVTPVEN